jgi:hypothetical protein
MKLKDNCLKAMDEKNRTAANRALELLGKEQGMFRDALDVKNTWDGDPKKLSAAQLEAFTKALEAEEFGGDLAAAEAAREAALKAVEPEPSTDQPADQANTAEPEPAPETIQ